MYIPAPSSKKLIALKMMKSNLFSHVPALNLCNSAFKTIFVVNFAFMKCSMKTEENLNKLISCSS